jgi:GT2 family glycosyltransferase
VAGLAEAKVTALDCTVVVPVHGKAALTAQCVQSMRDAYGDRVEVVVSDDGSPEPIAAALPDGVRVVRVEAATGFAAACNRGAAAATTTNVVFLNNDIVAPSGWLEPMLAALTADDGIGVVGAKLLFPDGPVQHAGVAISQARWPVNLYAGLPADHPACSRSRRMVAVTGACLLVSVDDFNRVGGFDEVFVNCYEDIDLCLRLAELGLDTWYCADASLFHIESATRDAEATLGDNAQRFAERWGQKIRPDDLDHFVADGLLRVKYEPGAIELELAPELGRATVRGSDPDDVVRVLAQRAEEVATLREIRRKLELTLLEVTDPHLRHVIDGDELRLDPAPQRLP